MQAGCSGHCARFSLDSEHSRVYLLEPGAFLHVKFTGVPGDGLGIIVSVDVSLVIRVTSPRCF